MTQQTPYTKLITLVETIRQHPDHRGRTYARLLDVPERNISRWLGMLRNIGVQIDRNKQGGLRYIDGLDRLHMHQQYGLTIPKLPERAMAISRYISLYEFVTGIINEPGQTIDHHAAANRVSTETINLWLDELRSHSVHIDTNGGLTYSSGFVPFQRWALDNTTDDDMSDDHRRDIYAQCGR